LFKNTVKGHVMMGKEKKTKDAMVITDNVVIFRYQRGLTLIEGLRV